jgi:DNA polymerase eta
VIALCDSDAFYAACEMIRLGVTEDTPLVVLQWNTLIAVNYPARTFGISRMDMLEDAKKRCPELVVVHVATYKEGDAEPGYHEKVDSRTHKVGFSFRCGRLDLGCFFSLDLNRGSELNAFFLFKVSLDYYRRESTKIIMMFKDCLPNGEIGEKTTS